MSAKKLWFSWSKSILIRKCRYKFKRHYIDKIKGEELEIMTQGKNVHSVIENYYKIVHISEIIKATNLDGDTSVFDYMYSVNEKIIAKSGKRMSPVSMNSCYNFTHFEVDRWYGLVDQCKGNLKKAALYYKPINAERMMWDYNTRTIFVADAVFKSPDGTGIVIDFKGGAGFPKTLTSEYKGQVSMYVILLNEGKGRDDKSLLPKGITTISRTGVVYLGGGTKEPYRLFPIAEIKKATRTAINKRLKEFEDLLVSKDYWRNWKDTEYGCKGGAVFPNGYKVERCYLYDECKEAMTEINKEFESELIDFE